MIIQATLTINEAVFPSPSNTTLTRRSEQLKTRHYNIYSQKPPSKQALLQSSQDLSYEFKGRIGNFAPKKLN